MLPTGRRFYSTGFNIASYVERIQDIAKKQQKAGRDRSAGQRGPRQGQAKSQTPGQAGQAKTQAQGQAAQTPRKQFQRPRNSRPQTDRPVQAQAQAQTQTPRPQRPQSQRPQSQRPAQSQTPRPAQTQAQNLSSGAIQAFAFSEPKPSARKPRGQKPNRRPRQQKPSARITVKPSVQANRITSEGIPLVVSAKESLDAVLKNTSSGYIKIDTLTPGSIASSLVQGPSFNARVWSVVNGQHSNVEGAVNSRVNGDFSPLLIEADNVSENAARTLSGNASLNSDQKQFLAKVAAGSMAPSQVKQVRI